MKIYKLTFFIVAAFVLTACQTATNNQPLSPTETMKALNEAAKRKDTEAIKKLVSKGTLDLLEQSAKQQNASVDELLKGDEGAPFQELPETRNERIAGETATIEIRNNATGDWETMPFVKENNVWKIALDRFMDDLMRKMNEEMKEIPAGAAPTANDKPSNSANSATNQ